MHLEAPIYGIPSHIENWATALAGLGAVGSLLYCIRAAFGRRSALPLYLFAGGALTCFIEPFIDTMGHAIFAQQDRIAWTSSFGRHIPAYIGLTLMFYVAPAYLALLGLFDKGVTSRRFLLLCGSAVVATLVFEVVPMHYDLWRYYGPQGLQFGQVPLWWGFVNAHGLVGTAVLLHLLRRVLPERGLPLLVPLMPALFLAVHTVYVAPAYLALLGLFDKGVTSRRFLILCGTAVVATIVFEVVPMHYDLWRYYGPQGLQFGQVPLWWGFVNAHGLVGTAVLLHLLRRVLPERGLPLLVPLMPALFLAVHTAGSVAGYLAINSTTSETAAYLGTLATCGLCSAFFWLYTKAVCTDAPAVTEGASHDHVLVRH